MQLELKPGLKGREIPLLRPIRFPPVPGTQLLFPDRFVVGLDQRWHIQQPLRDIIHPLNAPFRHRVHTDSHPSWLECVRLVKIELSRFDAHCRALDPSYRPPPAVRVFSLWRVIMLESLPDDDCGHPCLPRASAH